MALVTPPPAASDRPDAMLHALIATVEDIRNHVAGLKGARQHQDVGMYLKIADLVDSPPSQALIDARLASQLCIACGDADVQSCATAPQD